MRTSALAAAAFWLLAGTLAAAPVIDKVEPPSWWTKHSWNNLQLLLTGSSLTGAHIVGTVRGLDAKVQQVSADGKYAFVSVRIGRNAPTGTHTFRLQTPNGSVQFPWRLDAPADARGRFQGITADDVIYLIVPDRFANGDPGNDKPAIAPRPANRADPHFYHGGDFAGIRSRLGYLKELGVTSLWLLPVYQNSRKGKSPGYFYGYEAADFYDVESRYGSLQDLRSLVDEAHRLGLKVIQDHVVNHTGPAHPWMETPPTPTWFHDLTQLPRLQNNFDIASLADPYARPRKRGTPLRGWFAGALPDLNQEDPLVSDYLIQNALWWIGTTGIDGIRQDTYPYVDRAFWQRWQTAVNAEYPRLFVTGEITASTPAVLSFFEGGATHEGVDTRLSSMLDFPLFRAMRNVFGRGDPFTQLTDVLAQDFLYRHPEQMVAFFDNHDNARFLSLAHGDARRLQMAHTFLLTTRRIPHLFYGDEIAMGSDDDEHRKTTAADFPGGFPGDSTNAFAPEGRTGDAAKVYEQLRDLLRFRSEHPALRRGTMVHLLVDRDRYVFMRSYGGEHVIIALTRDAAASELTLDLADLNLPDALRFRHWTRAVPEISLIDSKLTVPVTTEHADIYWARQ